MRKKNAIYVIWISAAVILSLCSGCVTLHKSEQSPVASCWYYKLEDTNSRILTFYQNGSFLLENETVDSRGEIVRVAMLRGMYEGNPGSDVMIHFTAVVQCAVPGDPDAPWVDVTQLFAAEGLLTALLSDDVLIVFGGMPFTAL